MSRILAKVGFAFLASAASADVPPVNMYSYTRVGPYYLRHGQEEAIIYNAIAENLQTCERECNHREACVTLKWDARWRECTLYNVDYDSEHDWAISQRSVLYRKNRARAQTISAAFESEVFPDNVQPINMPKTVDVPELQNALRGSTAMSWRSELLSYVNQVRDAAGLARVCLNAKLNSAAQAQSDSGVYAHTWKYIESEDYQRTRLGQNIASGFSSVHSVFSAWYNEVPPYDGHRRNILNPAFNQMGAGFDSRMGLWTQNFGTSTSEPCV
eukprot:TRINITY_DN5132_c0_g2_i4.p1 TRINITY_DN5132_c0_g2~~TRINITY_DN5132_c0_g2_i4.p1  ORF type:complete len:271 (+),score=44.05 TRINITY_DN5132_c0_g2_i4:75-887(+)